MPPALCACARVTRCGPSGTGCLPSGWCKVSGIVERTALSPGFRLAEWEVRPEDGSLRSPQAAHRLEPLLMTLLVFLASRAGQVVSKQQLLDAVWEGRFVSDETIKGSLYQLRKALGDDPRRPRFVETLPKRGYRLLVPPVPLTATAPTAPGPDGTAEDLHQKGRAALSGQPGPAALQQARLYFERAVQSAPDHAAAWAGLARTYLLMVLLGLGRGREILPRARDAASRAVELDPERAEAHVALGAVRFLHDHDFAAAEEELRRAIELEPGDALAHRWAARLLSTLGRHDEAIAEARRALAADPLSLPVRRDLIEVAFLARRYAEALAESRQLFDIDPHLPDVQLGLVWIYALQGKEPEAYAAFRRGLELLGVGAPILERARTAYETGGLQAILRLWAALLEHEAELGQKNQIDLLNLYALLGERERCFALLERAYEEGNPYLLALSVSPVFDSLRADPGFARLLERLGFRAAG